MEEEFNDALNEQISKFNETIDSEAANKEEN
jgi:hypothetical protein